MGNLSFLSLAAVLATTALSEPISRAWLPNETGAAVVRRQGVSDDCTFFEAPENAEQDCEYFANHWDITVADFIKWNPSIGPGCSGIEIGTKIDYMRTYKHRKFKGKVTGRKGYIPEAEE